MSTSNTKDKDEDTGSDADVLGGMVIGILISIVVGSLLHLTFIDYEIYRHPALTSPEEDHIDSLEREIEIIEDRQDDWEARFRALEREMRSNNE